MLCELNLTETIISNLFMSHRYQLFDVISDDMRRRMQCRLKTFSTFIEKGTFSFFFPFFFNFLDYFPVDRWIRYVSIQEKLSTRLTVCSRPCRGSCHFWCSRTGRSLPILRCNTCTWDSQCASSGPSLAIAIFPLFVHRRRRIAEGPLTR